MAKKIGQKTKTPMPCRDPHERRQTFDEVATRLHGRDGGPGGEPLHRVQEPAVRRRLPGRDRHPGVRQAGRRAATSTAPSGRSTDKNVLPAICGRVCPQEEQCEKRLHARRQVRAGRHRSPRALRRRLCRGHGLRLATRPRDPRHRPQGGGRRLGAGGPDGRGRPGEAGARRHDLRGAAQAGRRAHLRHPGVPAAEGHRRARGRTRSRTLGVEIKTNHVIGRTFTVDELFTELGYEAVFIGTGAGLPHFPKIPGVNLIGVYSANEYLTRSNLMKAYRFPESDTPIDPRQARRGHRRRQHGHGLGAHGPAPRRRARVPGLPALARARCPRALEEIEHAEEEGVEIMLLTAPVAILGDEHVARPRDALHPDGARRARRVGPPQPGARSRARSSTSRSTPSSSPSARAPTR